MKTTSVHDVVGSLVIACLIGAGPAFADKPNHAGKGNKSSHSEATVNSDHRGGEHSERADKDSRSAHHFGNQQKAAVSEYYGRSAAGKCPPGLAKKNNGCMPPGQAKKWQVGHALPRDVVSYPVPAVLVTKIGPPPSGHKYVRVAGDILMIAIGTGMVVDAIQDLGRI